MTPTRLLPVENENGVKPIEVSAVALPYLTLVSTSKKEEEEEEEFQMKSKGRLS